MPTWLQLSGFGSVLISLGFAWFSWARSNRTNLSHGRNGLALAALFILSMNWAASALSAFLIGQPNGGRDLWEVMLLLSVPLDIVVAILAISLRGTPRVLVYLGVLAMFIFWPLGYH